MLSLQLSFVLLLILLNGIFAMAEAAMLASRQARLQHAAESGRRGARVALELAREPGRFLSTVQIGITVISVLASAVGSVTLGDRLATELERVPGFIGEYAHAISIARRGGWHLLRLAGAGRAGAEAHRDQPAGGDRRRLRALHARLRGGGGAARMAA